MDFNEMHKTEKAIEAVLNMSRLNPLEKIYAINSLSSTLAAQVDFNYKLERRSEKEISDIVDGLIDDVFVAFGKGGPADSDEGPDDEKQVGDEI